MKSGCTSKKAEKKRSIELPILKNSPDNSPRQGEAISHSRASIWRAGALIALTLLMIAHVIQWRLTGQTVSPIEPSETMHTLQRGAVNAGFIFFSLAILATLIFGRFVCGWGCHIVALQDFCAWLMKKFGIKPRPFRSRLLVFVPLIVALYMFVWPTAYKFFAGYFVEAAERTALPAVSPTTCHHRILGHLSLGRRRHPFSLYLRLYDRLFPGLRRVSALTPVRMAAFSALADKFAPGKIRVTDDCNQCGHCTATCTSNVLVHAEVKQYGMVVDPGCMKCMDCISVCPNDALYFGFGKPAVGVKKTITKNYSLTWPERARRGRSYFSLAFWPSGTSTSSCRC